MGMYSRPYVEDRASTTPSINGSLIVDGNRNQRLKRTLTASGNRRTWTISTWMKIVPSDNAAANHRCWFGADAGSATDASRFLCFVGDASDFLQLDLGGASVLDSYSCYRDPTGWYHHVLTLDTNYTRGRDQFKWYINGKLVNTWTTETAQTQYEELGWNNYASTHLIGANQAAGPGQWFDGSMTQFYHIDGQSIGAEYFGYTDPLTNTWTPKIFDWKGTTVNDGTVWSDFMTGGSTYRSPWSGYTFGPGKLFDGTIGVVGSSIATTDSVDGTYIEFDFSSYPGGGIPYKTLEFVYEKNGQNNMILTFNGVPQDYKKAYVYNSCQWFPVIGAGNKLTNIKIDKNGDSGSSYFSALRIDGVIMVDGKGSSFNTNPNNGTVWSNLLTTNAGDNFDGSGAKTKAFDGDESTKAYTANNGDGTTQGTSYLEMVFPSAINGILRVRCDNGNTVRNVTGGGDVLLATQSTGSDNQFVDCGTVSGLTNLRVLMSGTSRPAISIIELDGYVYIDSTVNNSFYLPFDGSAPIGEDQSGKGNDWTPIHNSGSAPLDKATGALPILNTVNGGNIANVGVRSDYGPNTPEIVKQSGCVSFDGSGDYFYVYDNPSVRFGTGDFTVEGWFYIRSYNSITYPTVISKYDNGDASWILRVKSDGKLVWYDGGGTNNESSAILSLGTWHYVAVCREGTGTDETKVYVDGALAITCTDSSDYDDSNPIYIGRQDASNANEFDGLISNLRVSKGTAVYTSAPTPPSEPLTNIASPSTGSNDGTHWSEYLSGTIMSGYWASGGFDGDVTTGYTKSVAPDQGSSITFTPPSALGSSGQDVIIYYIRQASSTSSSIKVNGSTETTTYGDNSVRTLTVTLGGSGLTSVELIGNSSSGANTGAYLCGIKVNGVILEDGYTKLLCCQSKTQPASASEYPLWAYKVSGDNDGTQWSAYMEPAGPTVFNKPDWEAAYSVGFFVNASQAFDGDTTTQCWADSASGSNTAGILVWTPPSPITIDSTLKLYCAYHTNGDIKINGTSIKSQLVSGANAEYTITGFTSIENISLHATDGSNTASLRTVEVDGVILVDPIKPNGTPYASDSEVSASCFLALPLVGRPNDVSNDINILSTPKTISVNGSSATSESSNFYGGSWDLERGSSQYLSWSSTETAPDTGDFTYEVWFNVESNNSYMSLMDARDAPDDTKGFFWGLDGSGQYYIYYTGSVRITAGNVISTDTWYHGAVTREGGILKLWLNGVLIGTYDTSNSDMSTDVTRLGSDVHSAGYYFDGKLQDARIYIGVAKYTSNFIPTSTNPAIVSDSPSGAAYSTQLAKITNGAVSLDGTGDYLEFADNADFAMGTGDFTAECWVYANTYAGAYNAVIDCRDATTQATGWILGVAGAAGQGGEGNVYVYNDGFLLEVSAGVPVNKWTHLAYVRYGGTHNLYVDGRLGDTSDSSYTYSVDSCQIGASYSNAEPWTGFISNVRIVKGSAVYTTNFTPPTSPLPLAPLPSNYPNDGKIWSNNGSYVIGHASHRLPKAFDGSTAANDYAMVAKSNGDNEDLVVTLPGLPSGKTVKFFGYKNVSAGNLTFNDGAVTLPSGYANRAWATADNTSNGSTDSFTMATNPSGTHQDDLSVYAVEVDGVVLIDNQTKLLCCQSTTSAIAYEVSPGAITANGDAVATNFNLFNTDIDTSLAESGGNYATWNPLANGSGGAGGYQNGNLRFDSGGSAWKSTTGTMAVSSGKWYYEQEVVGSVYGTASGNLAMGFGWCQADAPLTDEDFYNNSTQRARTTAIFNTGGYNNFGAYVGTVCTPATGDVMATALDKDDNIVKYYLNGIEVLSFTLSDTDSELIPWCQAYYNTSYFFSNFGQKPFKYAPPQGFQPLNSANLPSPGVVIPASVVGVTTYSGTTGAGTIKNDDIKFTPDFVWLKSTSNAEGNALYDTVRGSVGGNFYRIVSNSTDAQAFPTNELSSMMRGGFTVNNNGHCYYDGYDYVAWMWKASGPATPAADLVFGVDTSDNQFDSSSTSITADLTGFTFGSYSIPQSGNPGGFGANSTQVYKSSSGQLIKWSVSTTTATKYIWTSDDGINWSSPGSQYDTTTAPKNVTSKWIVLSGGANAANLTVTGDGHLFRRDGVKGRTPQEVGIIDGGSYRMPIGASVGTKQGFSIIKYIGQKPTVSYVPHGLTQAPDFIIIKNLNQTSPGFIVYHKDLTNTDSYMRLNETSDESSYPTIWNSTYPTSSIVTVGADTETNGAGDDMIMYSWHDVPGVQKFGSYIGNNSADGPYVELGFRPAVLLIKNMDAANPWIMRDSTRNPYNSDTSEKLAPNYAYEQNNSTYIGTAGQTLADFLSNGFKVRSTGGISNDAGIKYIYAAWAEAPSGTLYRGQSNAR